MAHLIRLDDSLALDGLTPQCVQESLHQAHQRLLDIADRRGQYADQTGWFDLPVATPESLIGRIEERARMLRNMSDIIVVCGVGGSSLGARAGLGFILDNETGLPESSGLQILFAGDSLSPRQLNHSLNRLAERRFSVIVVSKTGTTIETSIAFQVLWSELLRRFGADDARKRVVAVTDSQRGPLFSMARAKGFETFEFPRDIGGRYSVLSVAGLLPLAAAGLDIRSVLQGAAEQRDAILGTSPADNDSLRYATVRRLLSESGKSTELLAPFEPSLCSLAEWWKQLFGESEGKDGKGIFPASAVFTTDLHSLGQYIQQGPRLLFETIVDICAPMDRTLSLDPGELEGLEYLAGRSLANVNRQAQIATALAHHDGGVPVLRLSIPDMSARSFGAVVYFLEVACAVGGCLLGVNPFNQPGVDEYKKRMYELLNAPGMPSKRY
jgi:glucose-6-phosphate isomerase